MARSLRGPAVLMAVYVAVFIFGGPWWGPASAAHRNIPQIAIAIVLAVLAASGSKTARVLMIAYSLLAVFGVLAGSTHWGVSKPFAASFVGLACAIVQLGLLVSTPMYRRTRCGWSPGLMSSAPFLPIPRLWAALVSAGAGLVLTLLPFSDGFRAIACPAGAARFTPPCEAPGFGYPIAYRFTSIVLGNEDRAHWVNIFSPRGVLLSVFAADWVMWSFGILIVLYLVQLSRSREASALCESYTAALRA